MDTLFVKAKDQILALHYFNTGTSSCASKARRSPSLRNTYFQNRIQSPIHTQDRRTWSIATQKRSAMTMSPARNIILTSISKRHGTEVLIRIKSWTAQFPSQYNNYPQCLRGWRWRRQLRRIWISDSYHCISFSIEHLKLGKLVQSLKLRMAMVYK